MELARATVTGGWPKRQTNIPSEAQVENFPLHLKTVPRIPLDKAEALIVSDCREAWLHAKACIFAPQTFGPHAPLARSAVPIAKSLSRLDVARLLAHEIIEPFDATAPIYGTVNVFTVVEEAKGRRRMIAEPSLNDLFHDPGAVQLPTVDEVKRQVLEDGAILYDFPSYYNQFLLPEEARSFFVFETDGELYQLVTIATGQRQCPALAQSLSKSLAAHATCHLPNVRAAVYIDNIAFSGPQHECKSAAENLEKLCAELGAKIEMESTYGCQYQFLGMQFNHVTREISVGKKTEAKLQELEADLASGKIFNYTVRNFLRAIGILIWAFRVCGIRLHELYDAIKFVRRRARYKLDALANIWPALVRPLGRWAKECRTRTDTVQRASPELPAILYTDACPEGFGAIAFIGDTISVLAGRFRQREHINILEARALLFGLSLLPAAAHRRMLEIRVDNTTVLYTARKAHARSYKLNAMAGRIEKKVRQLNYEAAFHYVASAENLADAPSRWALLFRSLASARFTASSPTLFQGPALQSAFRCSRAPPYNDQGVSASGLRLAAPDL